jgi:hypothetical protein
VTDAMYGKFHKRGLFLSHCACRPSLIISNFRLASGACKMRLTDYDDYTTKLSHDECAELAKHMISANFLPLECKKFADVKRVVEVQRRDTTHGAATMS